MSGRPWSGESTLGTSPNSKSTENWLTTVARPTGQSCSPVLSCGTVSGEDVHIQMTSPPYPRSRLLGYMFWTFSERCPQNNDLQCECSGDKSLFQMFPTVPSSSNPLVDNCCTPRQGGVISTCRAGGGAPPPCEGERRFLLSAPHGRPAATDKKQNMPLNILNHIFRTKRFCFNHHIMK